MAAQAQTSPSGLARQAGLDSTTFNPSKRVSPDGTKLRWPSTESLAKAMRAANIDFAAFAALVIGRTEAKSLRALDLAERTSGPRFALDGQPPAEPAIGLPVFEPGRHQTVRIAGDALQPLYRDGDLLVLDRDAEARPGDRVFVETHKGETGAFEMREVRVQSVRLKGLTADQPDRSMGLGEIRLLQKIVWASQ